MEDQRMPLEYMNNIRKSKLDIYSEIEIGDPDLWIPAPEMEILLNNELIGMNFNQVAIRTRSKQVKSAICAALGYPVPTSFKKTKPRFLGQCLDVYVQKSSNLQIWNEEISAIRRYAIIKVTNDGTIEKVKVVTGDTLALLDKTGTLTRKYQARIGQNENSTKLITDTDTNNLSIITSQYCQNTFYSVSPTAHPTIGQLRPINNIFQTLNSLLGKTFVDSGIDQERNRGGELHRQVCSVLGYHNYQDDGMFPDIRHQLVEVKLQLSSTIDLGLVSPDSEEPLDTPQIDNIQIRHCDVRYVVFCAEKINGYITLTKLYVSTGEKFFTHFVQFKGKVVNAKLQIPLPDSFFDD